MEIEDSKLFDEFFDKLILISHPRYQGNLEKYLKDRIDIQGLDQFEDDLKKVSRLQTNVINSYSYTVKMKLAGLRKMGKPFQVREQLYTIKDVSEILKLTEPTVEGFLKSEQLKAVNIKDVNNTRGSIRIRKQDLDEFIENCEYKVFKKK